MKNRYDSIIQFHNAQPKGPGFLRLPKDGPKSDVGSARKTSESEREREREGSSRAPKRRSSRLSANEETPITKKLRSGGQMKSPMSEDSKHAATRFSRRLKKQQRTSCSPPSSPSSGHSSSDSQPSPVSHRGRGGQRSSRGAGRRGGGGGRGGAGRGVGRGGGRESTMVNSGQREEEDEGEESEEGEEAKEMYVSKDSEDGEEVRQEEEEEEEEEDSEVEEMDRRPRDVYDDRREPSSHELAQDSAHPASSQQYQGEEDDNYTICHGTPRVKGSGAVDMSSPASKLTPQTLASKTVEISSPSGAVSTTPPSALPHRTQHDGLSVGEQKRQLSSLLSSGAVGSGNRSQDPMLGQHSAGLHKEASANNWPGGLGPQFSHVPSGYYSAGIHPMHYPGHPAQHVPGANYPYGVYPWGHPAVGQPTREQHPYVSHSETAQQHARSVASSQASHSAHTASHTASSHVAYQHHAQSPHHSHSAASTPGETNKEPSSANSQGNEAVMKPPSSHEKHSLPSTHPHSHSSLRQLPGGPGSPQAPLSQVHHAFPRPPHALTTEQISAGTAMHHPAAAAATAFPYGFDPSNPAALQHMHHLWQQSQMQQHQIRAGVHPSQLPPHLQHSAAAAAGMWYPHVQQLVHGIPDDSAKRRAAAGSKHPSVDGSTLRMNANRNNSNNNGSNVSSVIVSDTRDSAIPVFANTQGSPSLHRASPTTTGRRLPPHAYSLLSHGDRDLTATSQQALGWTGHSTDVQKNAHLPSSFPR